MRITLIACIILSSVLFTSCSFLSENNYGDLNPSETTSAVADNSVTNNIFSLGPFNERDIFKLITLTKEEIENYLGTDYLIEFTGTEGGEMYRYENHDISLEYGPYDEVLQVYCGNQVNIYGTNSNMSFDEIKKIFVNAEIVEWSPDADPDIIFYRLIYETNNMLIMYISENKSGEDAWLRIIPVG